MGSAQALPSLVARVTWEPTGEIAGTRLRAMYRPVATWKEWGVPQEVRLTPPELADDFIAVLLNAGTPARKRGRVVVVGDDADAEPERHLELLFFLRTWALSHPDLAFEVLDAH